MRNGSRASRPGSSARTASWRPVPSTLRGPGRLVRLVGFTAIIPVWAAGSPEGWVAIRTDGTMSGQDRMEAGTSLACSIDGNDKPRGLVLTGFLPTRPRSYPPSPGDPMGESVESARRVRTLTRRPRATQWANRPRTHARPLSPSRRPHAHPGPHRTHPCPRPQTRCPPHPLPPHPRPPRHERHRSHSPSPIDPEAARRSRPPPPPRWPARRRTPR